MSPKLHPSLSLLSATLLSIAALAVAQNTEGTQGEAAPSPVTTPAPAAATGASSAVSATASSRTTSRRTATPASSAVVAEDLPKEDDATSTKTTAAAPASERDRGRDEPLTGGDHRAK